MKAKGLLGIVLPVSVMIMMLTVSCEELLNDLGTGDIREKIEGQWQCNETSEYFKSTAEIFTVYISPHPDDSTLIYIDNMYELGFDISAVARISGRNLYISSQTLGEGSSQYTIYGSGTISSGYDEINWNYSVEDGSGTTDNVTAIFTKTDY